VSATFDHVGERRPDGPPDAEEVDVDAPLEVVWVDPLDHPDGSDAGVGHDDVDPPKAFDRAGHGLLQRVAVADVGLEPHGPIGSDRGGELSEALRLEAGEGQVRALPSEVVCGLRADPTRGPGDEDGRPGYLEAVRHQNGVA